jgi:hypothetical protein
MGGAFFVRSASARSKGSKRRLPLTRFGPAPHKKKAAHISISKNNEAILSKFEPSSRNRKNKTSFLCNFEPSSRKQGVRQGSDLKVVTAPNDAADDEIGQNCKERVED